MGDTKGLNELPSDWATNGAPDAISAGVALHVQELIGLRDIEERQMPKQKLPPTSGGMTKGLKKQGKAQAQHQAKPAPHKPGSARKGLAKTGKGAGAKMPKM